MLSGGRGGGECGGQANGQAGGRTVGDYLLLQECGGGGGREVGSDARDTLFSYRLCYRVLYVLCWVG